VGSNHCSVANSLRPLRDGFALTAAGTYPAFRDVANGALRALFAAHGVTS
jgi:hypothetical protein